jgi:ribosomal silencing factor RsfS
MEFDMDDISKKILKDALNLEAEQLDDSLIPREVLLDDTKYDEIKPIILELKQNMNSTFLTALHNDAEEKQRWPLLNLVRQILHVYKYKMTPIRKSDGYTIDKKKKFKRYFLIQHV